ncbi:transporter [Leifsonia sp. F6_8S_P_1B]|uniref:Transporter n=1 Tax=Leifsonia williamsii TaxID=3035919 RepID=A0ABT8K7G7_9MICO|nr:transporter [Leifsonia williamsii]MDN4612982.1 transporter [Leifsonia williamsii]
MSAMTPRERIPLNTLAVPFGLAGLAEAWTASSSVLGLPEVVADVFWLIAAAGWVAMIVAHVVRGVRVRLPLAEQLRHPAQGPVAALVPVVGMLLGARLARVLPVAGSALVLASIAAALVLAGWLVARWLRGEATPASAHGGYLLPTVAAGLVAASAAAQIGWTGLGWAAFAVGMLFWVVVFAALLVRLVAVPALPAPLTPTLAILVAPPAVGGLAWIALTGSAEGPVVDGLAGLTVLLVAVQAALLPVYRRTPFSLGMWSFTFPFAAVAAFLTEVLAPAPVVGVVAAVASALAITTLVGWVAVASLRLIARSRPGRAEAGLAAADERVELRA